MNETKATRYQRMRRRVQTASLLGGGAILAALSFSPLASGLARRAEAAAGAAGPGQRAFALVLMVGALVTLLEAVALPSAIYLERRASRRFSRGAVGLGDLIRAQAEGAAVTLGLALAAGAVWAVAVAAGGARWWLVAAALSAGLLVAALRGAPVVLGRLGRARPVARPGVRRLVDGLARRTGLPVSGVYEWEVGELSTPALVTGVGQTRRVFVAAHLLRDWSDDEIAVVVAHEFGHHKHHDLWRTLALDVGLLLVALRGADAALGWIGGTVGLAGPSDLAALPLLLLAGGAIWTAGTPLRHVMSRGQERRADRFALAATGAVEAFVAAVRRLGAQHLAEERPSRLTRWLFAGHPSVAERVALAEAHRRLDGPPARAW